MPLIIYLVGAALVISFFSFQIGIDGPWLPPDVMMAVVVLWPLLLAVAISILPFWLFYKLGRRLNRRIR